MQKNKHFSLFVYVRGDDLKADWSQRGRYITDVFSEKAVQRIYDHAYKRRNKVYINNYFLLEQFNLARKDWAPAGLEAAPLAALFATEENK